MTAASVTPTDLTIIPRDRRFGRDEQTPRWWLNGDPVGTALYNALSATFPLGEAFFVESVRAYRDGVPPRLAEDIRNFTTQEVVHSREHLAFNRRAADSGYDLTRLEARLVATRLHELQRQLPDLTGGEGSLEPRFDGYEPVHGPPPTRLGT